MSKRKRESLTKISRTDIDTLNNQGFVILRNFIDIPDSVKTNIERQSSRTVPIFGPDRRRRQAKMYSRPKYMKRFESELNNELDGVISELSPNYIRDSWQILKSYAGCRRQPSHTDYEPRGGILEVPKDEVPLAAILALEDRTHLVAWPEFIGYEFDGFKRSDGQLFSFDEGDLLIFRGDLIHAGAEYPDRENIRLHCFIDNVNVTRENNRTFIVHDNI